MFVVSLVLLGPSSLTQPRLARAATVLGTTTYSSSTTWTLAGSPYILNGTVTVGSAATLTIEPGVVVKLNGQLRSIIVNGVLDASGTASNPIVFTSYQDDSVGGDSNGDGSATTGARGQWYRFSVTSTNALTRFRHVVVRYGGANITDGSAGVLSVSGACASVLVEDSVFVDNTAPAVRPATAGSCAPGVTVRRTLMERNGGGVYLLNGWALIEESTIRDNDANGFYPQISAAYTGARSVLTDNEITANGRGVRLFIDGGVDAAKWPIGTRNNIYANDTEQLYSVATKRTVDWKNNYWGDNVGWTQNPGVCVGIGQNAVGRLVFDGSSTNPPDGPISRSFYTSSPGGSACWYDRVAVGSTEYATAKFNAGVPAMAIGQSLGACSGSGGGGRGPFALNASVCISDPVNSATGSFTHSAADLSLPGVGVPFTFTRQYNSIDATPGPLGLGWTHVYNASLTVADTGDITTRAGDGQQLLFRRNTDGSYTAAAGGQATLTTIVGGYELITFDQLRYHFNSSGRLTSLVDRNEEGLIFNYDGNGRLSTITDAASRQITLTYDATSGLLTGVSVPDGRSVGYAYTSGRLTSVTDVRGKVWTYTYESHGLLEKEVDPLQHTVFRNVYADNGRVIEQYDALNNKTSFAWDPATDTLTTTDARNNTWKDVYANNVLVKRIDALTKETQFGHDADLNLTSVTGPDNKTTTFEHDARGNVTEAVAPASLGATKTFVHDSLNNVTSVTDGRGKVTSYGYDADGNNTAVTGDGITVAVYTYTAEGQIATFTNGRNYTTTYAYNASGNLESETDQLGNKTTYGYDSAGRMTSRVEPRGNVQGANPNDYRWSYTYDAAGQVLTETSPLGHVTAHVYDDAGNETSVTDANNKTTSSSYDAANRLLTTTAPDGGVIIHTYDVVGNKLTERNALNKTTTYTYDANNRLASATTPLGNKTTYLYDVSGNLIKQVEPRGNVQGANPDEYATTYSYDAAGRMLTETDPLGNTTTYTYDAVGNKTSVKDGNNRTTGYAYDGLNRLSSVTAPGGAATAYTYDPAGNLLTRTDARNNVTTYLYDAANRMTAMTLPLDRQWTYAYDAAGNRTSMVDANGNATQASGDGTTTYAYDRSGRLSAIDYSDSTPDVTYSYDGVGNRTQMTDGAGTQTYTYDNADRLTQVARGADTFAYLYDLSGNVTRRTYPDATVVDYTYDDDGRIATVVTGGSTTSHSYDAAGHLVSTTLPASNGHVEERIYDLAGRMTTVRSVRNGLTLVGHSYTLDAVGNPAEVVRTGSAAGTTKYEYDARDRLIEVCFQSSCPSSSDPFIRWTYDAVGNRLSEARPSGTTSYTYNDADELTARGATSFSYDANGNQTAAGGVAATYDLLNRPNTVGGSSFTYDGEGNRRASTIGSVVTTYLWDSTWRDAQLAVKRTNAVDTRYTYGQSRIAATADGATSYFHYDRTGSVVNVSSSDGTAAWTYGYEPYGVARTETEEVIGAPANAFKFAGELQDPTGEYYLRARLYDPTMGRLLSRDPLEPLMTEPAQSPYIYANDRPTAFADPTGCYAEPSPAGQQAVTAAASPVEVPHGRMLSAAGVPSPPPPSVVFLRGHLRSCRSAEHRDAGGKIATQVSPAGFLNWGVYMDNHLLDFGMWAAEIWVNGRRKDKKIQPYPPHGSLQPKDAPSGGLFVLTFVHAPMAVPNRVWFGYLTCTIP